MDPLLASAQDRQLGTTCPLCGADLKLGDESAQCRRCGQAHHRACWDRSGGCGSYDCSSGRRAPGAPAAAWVITPSDLAAATPAPVRVHAPAAPTSGAGTPPMSRAAVAAAVCAVAGIPIFGLVTGAVAVLLAAIALGATNAGRRRGTAVAAAALLLGLADMVGWAWVLSRYLPRQTVAEFDTSVLGVSEKDLGAASPEIAGALRANVLITRSGSMTTAVGSGVVLLITDGQAHILTNRHVVDPSFRESEDAAGSSAPGQAVGVRYVDGSSATGRVTWINADGLDLALVEAPVSGQAVRAAPWESAAEPAIGADVFAIGNPSGLGWTHTTGTVSQLRERRAGRGTARIIQTSAPINPGNSGGGLYDKQGRLVGINTWSGDKRTSEGLGFAISLAPLESLRARWIAARGGGPR